MRARSERFTVPSLQGVGLRAIHRGDSTNPTLVLLHGGGANAHWWDHLAPRLAEAFYVVALDFRGHGDSDYPEDLVVGAFSDDLDALLDHLDAADAVLVGHSMGAHMALDRAARCDHSRALVLLDLAWCAPRAASRSAQRALSIRRTYRSRERAVARFGFLPGAANADESLRRAIAERSVSALEDGRFGFKFDPRWFSLPYRKLPPLSCVRCPTLLVRGIDSPLLTQNAAKDLASQLHRARVLEIEGAGHHVQIDQPERVHDAIRAFLAEVL